MEGTLTAPRLLIAIAIAISIGCPLKHQGLTTILTHFEPRGLCVWLLFGHVFRALATSVSTPVPELLLFSGSNVSRAWRLMGHKRPGSEGDVA